nr:retrotransposon protein, putative, Ty1-copia subclass [Tanacetum cinerariifolium]
ILRPRAFGLTSLVRLKGLSNPWRIFCSLIRLRVAFHAINARRLPLAPLVYTLVRPLEERQSVSSYVLKIKGYIENLERLGHPVTLGLGRNCPQYLAELLKKKKNAASGAGGSGFLKNVSCMSGKMARKPYTHQVERSKDLLGLIHTDVCGPFKIMSRQGASYFVTFTDDFSRCGCVYLLKHKHEVFETFKVFQKEVENQLGKTIKSLRSDNRGKYMSQEFLDHLKDHGIIAHCTPPYTPQHNGVSERRNRTLLDMVRSMMSQTTLPKSFWDYALEIAARILNMVPTKKVEKIPYEVWHGQAPKLSYLKV